MEAVAIFNPANKTPKYLQIINWVIAGIESGNLKPGMRLASIQKLASQKALSSVTVSRAYLLLAKKVYITLLKGKGFYVHDHSQKTRILLIFNKLSSYKRATYYGLVEALKNKAIIDLQVHHYNLKLLGEMVSENERKYNFYVIMPHFFKNTNAEECIGFFEKIPAGKLLLLDKLIPGGRMNCRAVYQDFEQDIYSSLVSVNDLMHKYNYCSLLPGEQGTIPPN